MDAKLTSLTPREIEIKRKLVETTKAIRKKLRAIRTGNAESEVAFEQKFKPIIEPLKKVVESVRQPASPPRLLLRNPKWKSRWKLNLLPAHPRPK